MSTSEQDMEEYLTALLDLMRVLGLNETATRIQDNGRPSVPDLTVVLRDAKREIMGHRANATQATLNRADDANEGFTLEDAEQAMSHPAEPLLRRSLGTYTDRRGAYGASEQRFADIAMAMFPNGLTLDTRVNWVRFGIFVQILSKLSRYTKDWNDPHVDSMHDLQPYSAMLEAEDRRHLGRAPFYMEPAKL